MIQKCSTQKRRVLLYSALIIGAVVTAAYAVTNLSISSTVFGQPTATTSAAGTNAVGLSGPREMSIDNTGLLWVADVANNRVLAYASTSDTIATYALSNFQDTQRAGTTTIDSASLNNPVSVSSYKGTHAWFIAVSDFTNNRVLVWILSSENALGSQLDSQTSYRARPALVIGQRNFTSKEDTQAATLSMNARFARSVLLAPGNERDTVFLFISTDTNHSINGSNRVYRFPLKDTFEAFNRETAVLAYSREAADQTPFGAAPKADLIYGNAGSVNDTAAGLSRNQFYSPAGMSTIEGTGILYVADKLNNRVLLFRGATSGIFQSTIDTSADYVIGQSTLDTNSNVWFQGSETALVAPVSVTTALVNGNGVLEAALAVGDLPLAGQSGRAAIYDNISSIATDSFLRISRWFGMSDTNGFTRAAGTDSVSLAAAAPFLANAGGSVFIADRQNNRIIIATSAFPNFETFYKPKSICIIDLALGRTSLADVMPSLRSTRDLMLETSMGRLIVSGYYSLAGLALACVLGVGVVAWRRG